MGRRFGARSVAKHLGRPAGRCARPTSFAPSLAPARRPKDPAPVRVTPRSEADRGPGMDGTRSIGSLRMANTLFVPAGARYGEVNGDFAWTDRIPLPTVDRCCRLL